MVWWNSIRSDWHKLRTLSAAQVGLLGQACVWLPLTRFAVWWLGFRRWQRTLDRWSRLRFARAARNLEAHAIARLVQAATRRYAGPDSCLIESLVLWWLLRRHGFDGALRIGVRKQAGQLQAHAWVELQGQALNDAGEGFVPFDTVIVPSGSQAA